MCYWSYLNWVSCHTVSLGINEVSKTRRLHKKRPFSFQYSRKTKALPEISSMISVCDFLCSDDGRYKQLETNYQKYWAQSQRTQSVWEWINSNPSKLATVRSVPTSGPDKKVSFLRHCLAICYVSLQCVKGSSYQRNHPTATTGCFLFWWLKGTYWVWRREPLIYFRHFSLADSNLKEKEQARSLICLLGMRGSHGSPDRGHLFGSQPLQTHTERWCQKGHAQALLTRHLR